MTKKLSSLVYVLAPILILVVYLPVVNSFFEQDEWLAFNRLIILKSSSFVGALGNIFHFSGGHYTPFNLLFLFGEYLLFGITFKGYALVSVILHLAVSFLVYFFVYELLNSKRIALATAFLFGISASAYQATTWVIADTGTHLSAVFGLVSLILFFKFIKYASAKMFLLSFLSLFASLFFKENTAGLLVVMPLAYLLFASQDLKKERIYLYLLLGFPILLVAGRLALIVITKNLGIFSGISLTNLVLYPIKALSQSILPSFNVEWIVAKNRDWLSTLFGLVKGTSEFDDFRNNVILLASDVIVFTGVLALVLRCIWSGGSERAKQYVFALVFVLINSLVFVLSPERNGMISTVDSRNLYFLSVGTALEIVLILDSLFRKNTKIQRLVLLLIIVLNIFSLHLKMRSIVTQGTIRREIIQKIVSLYPELPKKVVFFTESNSSFYGLPESEPILPFQSGFGQTLLAYYSNKDLLPEGFYKDRFLWGITDQGYKENEGRGFGYFRNFNELIKSMEDNNLKQDSIVAFRYYANDGMFEDMTQQTRWRVESAGMGASLLSRHDFRINKSPNITNVGYAIDGDRRTCWSSEIPYATTQSLIVSSTMEHSISRIVIDSSNGKDQDKVGYEVYSSPDAKGWNLVFKSILTPPDSDGKVTLYLKPTLGQYWKITQVGTHNYAPWIICEISFFEGGKLL